MKIEKMCLIWEGWWRHASTHSQSRRIWERCYWFKRETFLWYWWNI